MLKCARIRLRPWTGGPLVYGLYFSRLTAPSTHLFVPRLRPPWYRPVLGPSYASLSAIETVGTLSRARDPRPRERAARLLSEGRGEHEQGGGTGHFSDVNKKHYKSVNMCGDETESLRTPGPRAQRVRLRRGGPPRSSHAQVSGFTFQAALISALRRALSRVCARGSRGGTR